MENQIDELGVGLLFFIGGIIFVIGGGLTSYLLAPHRPNPEKLTTYECGEEPVGSAWGQINFRFYVMGLVFLIFDVEILLLFPWAVVFSDKAVWLQAPNWGLYSLIEIMVFIFILFAGYLYALEKKALDWNYPESTPPTEIKTGIPTQIYVDLQAKLKEM